MDSINCPNCGAAVAASRERCGSCGAQVDYAQRDHAQRENAQRDYGQRDYGQRDSAQRRAAAAAHGAPPRPAGGGTMAMPARAEPAGTPGTVLHGSPVILGNGEVIWRKYQAVRLGGSSGGEGTLYVTDARVVFYAKARGRGTQRESELVQQTKLSDITGLAAYVSYRISLGLMLLTIVFALGTLLALVTGQVLWIFIDGVLTGLCLLMLLGSGAKRGSAGVKIHSRATMTSPINFGSFAAQRGGLLHFLMGPFAMFFHTYTAFDVAFGAPGADSRRVIEELGALILDLQTQGSLASQHWGVSSGGAQRSPQQPAPQLAQQPGQQPGQWQDRSQDERGRPGPGLI